MFLKTRNTSWWSWLGEIVQITYAGARVVMNYWEWLISGGTPRRVDKAHKALFACFTDYRSGVLVGSVLTLTLTLTAFWWTSGIALTFLLSFCALDTDGIRNGRQYRLKMNSRCPCRDWYSREERAIIINNSIHRLDSFSPRWYRTWMSTATIASIIDQVKLDVFSKTQTTDNANKRKEISRTFICEPETICWRSYWLFIQPILSQVECLDI